MQNTQNKDKNCLIRLAELISERRAMSEWLTVLPKYPLDGLLIEFEFEVDFDLLIRIAVKFVLPTLLTML